MAEVAFNPGLSGSPVSVKVPSGKNSSSGSDGRFNQALDLISNRAAKNRPSKSEETPLESQPVNDEEGAAAEVNPLMLLMVMGLVSPVETSGDEQAVNAGQGVETPLEDGVGWLQMAVLPLSAGLKQPQGPAEPVALENQLSNLAEMLKMTDMPEETEELTAVVGDPGAVAPGVTPWNSLSKNEVAQAWPGLNPEVAAEVSQILSVAAQVLEEAAETPEQAAGVKAFEKNGSDLRQLLAGLAGNGAKPSSLSGSGLVMQPTLRQEAEALQGDAPVEAGEAVSPAANGKTGDAPLDLAVLQTSKQVFKSGPNETEKNLFQVSPLQQGETNHGNQVVESAAKTVSVFKPTEVFSQIVERARVMVDDGASEMRLDLKPDSLGKIQLKVSLENQLISARFVAESDQVKALIESNLVDLKRMLNQNGVQVDQVTVTVDQQAAGGENFDGQAFAGNAQSGFAGKGGPSEDADVEPEMIGFEQPGVQLTQIDLKA